MSTSLNNLNLFVRDIAIAKRFYTEVLGLEEDEQMSAPPTFFGLRAGNCTLSLQDATAPGVEFGGSQSVEIGFEVDDVEAVRSRLIEFGIDVGSVQQMGWGSALDARDPEGHRLTIYRRREGGSAADA